MAEFAVHTNSRQERQILGELLSLPKSMNRVLAAAVNKTAKFAGKDASDLYRKRFRAKAAAVKRRVELGQKANTHRPNRTIHLSGRLIKLIDFASVRQLKGRRRKKPGKRTKSLTLLKRALKGNGGVAATVVRGRRQVFRGAFIETGRGGVRQVFRRYKPKGGKKPWRVGNSERPIGVMHGLPSVSVYFEDNKVQARRFDARIIERYEKNLISQVDRELARLAR